VVEAGSFTRAADSLDMPIATLSKLVQELEAHLGVRLLQRTTRRVTVTPEGQDYYAKTTRCCATWRISTPPSHRPQQAARPAARGRGRLDRA
jgi:DNA-binding transcriptional LysR family regulator